MHLVERERWPCWEGVSFHQGLIQEGGAEGAESKTGKEMGAPGMSRARGGGLGDPAHMGLLPIPPQPGPHCPPRSTPPSPLPLL